MTNTSDLLSDRQATHGSFQEVAAIAQSFREIMRDTKNWEHLNDTQREALDSMASKFGRIASGNPHVRDHWDDIAGYAALASMHCNSDTNTVQQDIANAIFDTINVGGGASGVDEDGEKFPSIVLPKVGKKKGFFSAGEQQ